MKRTLLITQDFPPNTGGVARYYAGVLSDLPSDHIEVLIPPLPHTLMGVQHPYIVHRKTFFWRFFWPQWLPLLWYAWRIIREEKIEEVWVGQVLPIGTVVWLLKKFHVSRFTFQVFTHGMDVLVPQKSKRKIVLMKKIFSAADRIVANSNFTKQEVVKLGVPEEKIMVVYPCVDKSQMPTSSSILDRVGINPKIQPHKEQYNLEGKKVLLTVARLVKRKGIDLVFQALQHLSQTKSRTVEDLVYVIVGDGPECEALKFQVSRFKFPVHFVGAVNDEELAAWYDLSDVFIMTPRRIGGDVEGFGMVYLEANAHGKPVIGTRSGGVTEAIADGVSGLLVDEEDVQGIARAIEQLFSDGALRKRLGEQGRARVEHQFESFHLET